MGFTSYGKYHTIVHIQGLGFTWIQGIFKSFTLIRETFLISAKFYVHPIPIKNYNHKIHKVMLQICTHKILLKCSGIFYFSTWSLQSTIIIQCWNNNISSENIFLHCNWCQTYPIYELVSPCTSQGPGNAGGILTAQILLPKVLLQANTKPLNVKGHIYMYCPPTRTYRGGLTPVQHRHQPLKFHQPKCTSALRNCHSYLFTYLLTYNLASLSGPNSARARTHLTLSLMKQFRSNLLTLH
jgi:hypothetical protein